MESSILVRPANHTDFSAVAGMLSGFAIQHYRWQPDQFRPSFIGFTAAMFQTWLDEPDQLHLAGEVAGEVVGYASASRWAGGGSSMTVPRRSVHVMMIMVAPDQRRMGLGRALFRAIEAWAEDFRAEFVSLYVSAMNDFAKAFYASLGYEPTGEVRAKPLRQVKRFENEP